MVRIINVLSKEYDSQVSIFGTSRFLSSKSDNYGWFIDEAFILPYYISKKLFFRYIIFPSQTIYLTKGITADDERRFLDDVVCLIKNDLRHVDFILQSPTNVVFKIYPIQFFVSLEPMLLIFCKMKIIFLNKFIKNTGT